MYTESLSVKLQRNNDDIMTTWEIQDFLAKLTANYYKLDVINEISKEINSGVSLENIIIFDRSFDFKNNYNYLKKTNIIKLSDVNGAKNFFHLGLPIGYLPSKHVLQLSFKFSVIRKINTLLNKKINKLIDKKYIKKIIFLEIKKFKDFIEEYSKKLIDDNITEFGSRKIIFQRIDDIIYKEYDKVEEYDRNSIDINCINKKIISNDTFELQKDDEIVYNEYFLKFKDILSNYERPVVGVLSKDHSEVKILCKSYLCKDTQDPSFLDLKSFSHNSPTIVELFVGSIFAVPLIALLILVAKEVKQDIENTNSNIGKKGINFELNESTRSDSIESSSNKYKEESNLHGSICGLEEVCDKHNLRSHLEIKNSYVRKDLEQINQDIIDKTNANIVYYEFNNCNIDIKRNKVNDN